MRLSQALLAAAVVILASSNDIASAATTEVSTNAAVANAETARTLMSFKETNLNQDVVQVSNEEERAGGAVGAAAARAGTRDNTGFQDRQQGDGKQVTVTTYHNNGLLQKFRKWWKRIFKGESGSSTKTQRLRHDTKTQES